MGPVSVFVVCLLSAMLTIAGRLAILRRCLLPNDPLPYRLSFQAAQGQLHHAHLPPQHQLQRQYLSRHPAGPMESGAHNLQGYVYLFYV